MSVKLVSYDLDKPGKDYPRIINELERIGAKRVLYSEWLLKSALSDEQLRNHLQKFVDGNDMLLVVTVSSAAWNSLMITDQAVKQLFAA
jgi:hypothetical protein